MPELTIDDRQVDAVAGENVIQAASRAGIEIPYYCWHPELTVVASCRMCLVEVGQKQADGAVAFDSRLQPACQIPAKPGTFVRTDSEKVKRSRAMTLEYLLLNHPLDCSICDQAGECYLQDYTFKFGNAQSRLKEPKVQRMDKYHIGDQIALFTDRCVMCTRCVRFTREISGGGELQIIQRGSTEEIDVFPGQPCNDKLAGNVVDLCPVGALCSKDFLYAKRVWWLKSQAGVCAGCSTGCSITVDQSDNRVFRLRPRHNDQAQGHFMCDDGRFGFKYIHAADRILAPIVRLAAAESNGASNSRGPRKAATAIESANVADDLVFRDPWPDAIAALRGLLTERIRKAPQRTVMLFSPFMTIEEAYLLAQFAKGLNSRVNLAQNFVPVVGTDDHYPKTPTGEPLDASQAKFTIRAEKCPNRKGVETVLAHFQRPAILFDDVVQRGRRGEWETAFVVGGYPEAWVSAELDQALGGATTLIVQDFFESPLTERAAIVIPSASFAEREGSFVNHAGLAQEIRAAIRPPDSVWPSGRVFFELAGRTGVFNARLIRKEMAAKISAFAALEQNDVRPNGVFLDARSARTTAPSGQLESLAAVRGGAKP